MDSNERIVALIDMDCFYVQVEQRRCPSLRGQPCAVVQYNQWKGGGIIAVSYEARDYGVTRSMRGDDAKAKCPEIQLVQVPVARGKANLTHYREAGAEVIDVLFRFCDVCEKASVDEAYLDLTKTVERKASKMSVADIAEESWNSSFIEGFTNPENKQDKSTWMSELEGNSSLRNLAVGAIIVSEIRKAVLSETTFTCSAGIANNKVLAKLACGLHKPNKQTILPMPYVSELFKTVKLRKVRNLGGKLGLDVSAQLNAEYMADIAKFSLNELKARFGDKTGEWVYLLSQGIDHEPVRVRQLAKSVGCGKNFPGKTKLATVDQVRHWLQQLVEELHERLEKEVEVNKRHAKLITIGVRPEDAGYSSRACALRMLDVKRMTKDIYEVLLTFRTAKQDSNVWEPAITNLSLSATKFTDKPDTNTTAISTFFKNVPNTEPVDSSVNNTSTTSTLPEENTDTEASSTQFLSAALSNASDDKESTKLLNSNIGIRRFLTANAEVSKEAKSDINETVTNKTTPQKTGIQAFFLNSSEQKNTANNDKLLVKSEEQNNSTTENTRNDKLFAKSACSSNEVDTDSRIIQEEIEETIDVDVVVCKKCGEKISAWELPEHLDFHFAKELQEQERTSPAAEPPRKKLKTAGKIFSFFSSSNK